MSIPSKMKALITEETKTAKVEEIPVPEIDDDDDDVLVKTEAIALNPTDWKRPYSLRVLLKFGLSKLLINFPDVEFITNPGTIVGCDFAGTVVRVGKNVTSVAVGDRVAGCTHGGRWKDIGAFAEYTKTPAELVWKVPSSLSQEQAATMNCGWVYRL